MAFLIKQTLEYSDGTSQVIDYTEVPVESLADYEPLMDESAVEEAPVEAVEASEAESVEEAPVEGVDAA